MPSYSTQKLTPTRPYLVRALYEWLEDNQFTPYLMVDATKKNVKVPMQYVHDGRIVLNIASRAVGKMSMNNDFIHFHARFGGVSQEIWVPLAAVVGIYAKEDGTHGIFFDPSEYDGFEDASANPQANSDATPTEGQKQPARENTAGLKIIK